MSRTRQFHSAEERKRGCCISTSYNFSIEYEVRAQYDKIREVKLVLVNKHDLH